MCGLEGLRVIPVTNLGFEKLMSSWWRICGRPETSPFIGGVLIMSLRPGNLDIENQHVVS